MQRRDLIVGALVAGLPARSRWDDAALRFSLLLEDDEYVHSRPCYLAGDGGILFMRARNRNDGRSPVWSDDLGWSLWAVATRGSVPTLVFEDSLVRATRPSVHRQSGRIAFTGISGGRAELWVLDPDGSSPRQVPVGNPPRARVYYPSWHPDGDRVAVTDYATHEVLEVSVSSGLVRSLTTPERVWAGMAAQSPSGAGPTMVFAGQEPGTGYDPLDNVLWQIPEDGTGASPVDRLPGRMPAWSPTGRHLAFSSVRGRRSPGTGLFSRRLPSGRSSIFVAPVDQTVRSERALAVSPIDHLALHPAWSPTGREIACMVQSLESGRSGIGVIELPGEFGVL